MLSGSMDTKIKVSPASSLCARASRIYTRLPDPDHLLALHSLLCQLWDVYHEGQCLRTFQGHSKAVRDVTFSNDGRRFLSAGYDRQMKLWDTETGQCIKAFSNGKVPYVVKFHPDEDKQNIFLAGMSDKKIIQVHALVPARSSFAGVAELT